MLLLTENDVRQLLTMDEAIEAVESALRKQALEEAQNIPRTRCQTDHAMLHVMSASAKTLGVLGYKAYATTRKGANFHVGLFDGRTGNLTALLQADWLGQMRTGAASAVATKYMARPEAQDVGCFGSGKQARTQVLAICRVRKVRRVHVFSPSEDHRRLFAREMSEECQTDVVPVPRPEMAAHEMDIVITATSSREPVLSGNWLAEGTHLNVVGSNFLAKAEIDPVAVRRAATIIVDSKDQARLEAGDFAPAQEDGGFHWSDVHELGQVIVGRYKGREHAQDITLFKSLGIALEDIAVAGRIVANAQAKKIGREIDW